MENSKCFSRVKFPEYTRCRVSCVRDFPLGCGPFAHLSSLNADGTGKISVKKYPPPVEAVRDFPSGCGPFAHLSNLNADDIKKISEETYPPRSVKAVRDLPFFCGIKASPEAKKFSQEKSVKGYKLSSTKPVKIVLKQAGHGNKFQPNSEKKFGGRSLKKDNDVSVKPAYQGTRQLDLRKEYSRHDEKEHNNGTSKPWSAYGCPPSFSDVGTSRRNHDTDTTERNKVKKILNLFRDECQKLLLEEERKGGRTSHRRVDLEVFKMLKDRGISVKSGKHVIGAIPGIEVGDKFQYRVELILIGLHHQIQGGIAYGNFGGKVLATSIVASGGYADDLHKKDSLVYTGHGGNSKNTKDPQDQKLERGNLALKNSVQKNPVRVIRGSELLNGSRTYVYDGLYLVEKYWQERGSSGKLVFKFQMNRIGATEN